MSCYCDYEAPEFYFKTMPKARKEYNCYDCDCKIQIGEIYENVRAKWNGEFRTSKTCIDCVTIRKALQKMKCFCWSHGGLFDDIEVQFQEADFEPGLRFLFLRIIATHRWRKQRAKRREAAKARFL